MTAAVQANYSTMFSMFSETRNLVTIQQELLAGMVSCSRWVTPKYSQTMDTRPNELCII